MDWIDEARSCLAGSLPIGSRMIVFGSRARGDAGPESDLDLLVIEPEVADRFAEMARLSTLLGQRLIPADVVVMSAKTFSFHYGKHHKAYVDNLNNLVKDKPELASMSLEALVLKKRFSYLMLK